MVFDPPGPGGPNSAPLARVSDIKRRNSARLFAIPDVVGHGVGMADDGTLIIEDSLLSKPRVVPSRCADHLGTTTIVGMAFAPSARVDTMRSGTRGQAARATDSPASMSSPFPRGPSARLYGTETFAAGKKRHSPVFSA